MLEKPPLSDETILDQIQQEYGICANELTFLPLGADVNTAVYRLEAADGHAYFLKLRQGDFAEITVTLPKYLQSHGIRAVISPLVSASMI